VAAFTNFTQDHLDFHGTMEDYFSAKSMLFDYLGKDGCAVLNRDDPALRALSQKLGCKVITCGIEQGAMIRAENVRVKGQGSKGGLKGMLFDVITPNGGFEISSDLIGRFNVYNILLSAGVAYSLGINGDVIAKGIRNTVPVEGRFENVDEGQDFLCIVDYAHTPDALRKLIEEARALTNGKVITVFGCGGDRDKTKRPLMGSLASDLSDFVIITSDNPRTEEPMAIIKDITSGISKNKCAIEPDRAAAIEKAVSMANAGDVLLIAGKGHETYQEINGVRHHFSDKEEVGKIIKKLNIKNQN
ncbi:MAG: UDP-N-acetylmuramoyl-L-alanyl-D-glutamate--2,6-diaminopimelate ligase, partial [Nitrospirae bacterium]|nr:UDP-N-acetylmuramoyl-L-alanyl-D-glutamate--2,6-diaminopimelate ligase [Nitrospirota bacterium]